MCALITMLVSQQSYLWCKVMADFPGHSLLW